MKITIDMREKDLLKKIVPLCNDLHLKISIESTILDLGDVVVSDDDGEELLIIERKTIKDLAASIKDGRYEEQSFRLNNIFIPNHNIIYLIEGDLNFYNQKYTRIPKKTLYSAMFCLNYYKGFSLVRTASIRETAEYILRMTDKLARKNNVLGYYNGGAETPVKNYCEVVKKVKKNNVTPDNIGSIILSQIPGISSVTSLAIMKQFGSLYALIKALEKDNHCLNELSYETKSGKTRHISKTCIENIIKFLLYEEGSSVNLKL